MIQIPLVQDEDLDPVSKAILDRFAAKGAAPPDLYRLLANAPELLKGWTDFAWPLRESPRTDRGLRELVIMRTAILTQAKYEWAHHWAWALEAGVTRRQLEALVEWRAAACFTPLERAALDLCDAVVAGEGLPDEALRVASLHYSPPELVQLALTASFYVCVARFLRTFDLQVEHGHESVPALPKLPARPMS